MNIKVLATHTFARLVSTISPAYKSKPRGDGQIRLYSFQSESQILDSVDYKYFYVYNQQTRKQTCFIIMTKRGENPNEDVDTLVFCDGRVFNPGHWMNEIVLTLTQKFIDIESKEALAAYDTVAKDFGFPDGKTISVIPKSVTEPLNTLDIDEDNISRLQYVADDIELTL